MFRRKGVMEDVPLDLIIIPVPRQSLQLGGSRGVSYSVTGIRLTPQVNVDGLMIRLD